MAACCPPPTDRGRPAGDRRRRRPYPVGPPQRPDGDREIYLKLENLQPIGSFKTARRGCRAGLADAADLAGGVVTASAGNMGQGAAWFAGRLGVPCTVSCRRPRRPPRSRRWRRAAPGVLRVSAEDWWRAFEERRADGVDGVFVHAFDDPQVMAGNATIALEVVEDLPEVTAVLVPWGGGGLSCGIAAGVAGARPHGAGVRRRGRHRGPVRRVAGRRRTGHRRQRPSFVDGIGSRTVLAVMYDRATGLGIGSRVAPVDEVAAALRTLVERAKVLAEGAGATPVACALADADLAGPVVCVVSGGMIDLSTLVGLLSDQH